MNLIPFPSLRNLFISAIFVVLSFTNLLANDPQKPIFKNNQAKTPDFSLLENQKKALLLESSKSPSIFNLNQENLKIPRVIQFNNPKKAAVDDTSLEKKNKNWLQDDLQKLKQVRLERQRQKDENTLSEQQESYYRKTDIFSLGINQAATQPIKTSFSTLDTNLAQQVSSIDFKPAISQSSHLSLGSETRESILGTSSSLQNGLQNIQQRSSRDLTDSSPSFITDKLSPQLNTSAINERLMSFKPQAPHQQLINPSMQAATNTNLNPLNPNTTNSLSLSNLNNTLGSSPSFSNPFTPTNINNLLNPSTNTSPKVLGNPNLNPNKINDPLERLYR